MALITKNNYQVVIAGTGNVSRSLIYAFRQAGVALSGVFTRGNSEAIKYLNSNNISVLNSEQQINEPCICFLTVPDRCIEPVANKLKLNSNSIVVHTAGSVDIDVFRNLPFNYGVFYPVQTFHKSNVVDFKDVNVCLEAYNADTLTVLNHLTEKITDKIHFLNSYQRLILHIAAVFACNFSNLMYSIAEKISAENNIEFSLLYNLILETAKRATQFSPSKIQTGPAVRNDFITIEKHLKQIQNTDKQIYELLTEILRNKK